MKVKVFAIKWGTDGEKIKLPKTLEVNVPDIIAEDVDEMEEYIADEISCMVGFCHFGFEYQPLKK